MKINIYYKFIKNKYMQYYYIHCSTYSNDSLIRLTIGSCDIVFRSEKYSLVLEVVATIAVWQFFAFVTAVFFGMEILFIKHWLLEVCSFNGGPFLSVETFCLFDVPEGFPVVQTCNE